MNNKIKAIFGLTAIAGAGIILSNVISSPKENVIAYKSRTVSVNKDVQGFQGAQEYYKSLRKNVITGEIEASDYEAARLAVDQMTANSSSRATGLSFVEEGPDNIGGRTRSIAVDPNNINIVYAGSVSGGVWKSINRGNTWERLDAFQENLGVSSVVVTKGGSLYVSTGSTFENPAFSNSNTGAHQPGGVWYSEDAGVSFQKLTVAPLNTNGAVNQMIADPIANDKVWIAGGSTIRLISIENKTTVYAPSGFAANIQDVKVSADGQVIVCNQGRRTFVSTDAGANFSIVSSFSPSPGELKESASSTITRIEYAISHEKNSTGKYNIYAAMVRAGGVLGKLGGISVSQDNGQTWQEVIPETADGVSAADALPTDPYSGGTQWQGNYDNIITAVPGSPNSFLIGGVRLFRFDMSTTQPPFGNFYAIAANFADFTSSTYVHSDIHEFHWDNSGRLYIGTDGGIHISDDATTSTSPDFYVANRGYRSIQFYSLMYSKHGDVIGGAQDNGTYYKNVATASPTSMDFRSVLGGDGFDADISFLDPNILFATVQNGSINRTPTGDAVGMGSFTSAEMNAIDAQFYTVIRLGENDEDFNSTDSVDFIARAPYNAGDTISVTSRNANILFDYELTQPLVFTQDTILIVNDTTIQDTIINGTDTTIRSLPYQAGDTAFQITQQDTIRVQDIKQSLFAVGYTGSGGVWLTRGALRFGTTPVWYKVINSVSTVRNIEYSKDGDIMYVGESNGRVTRVSGLNNFYYDATAGDTIINGLDTNYNHDSASYLYADVRGGQQGLGVTVIRNSGAEVTGIAVDPNDPDHVVITLAGYGAATNILEATDAASSVGTANFTSIKGNLPTFPVYDAIIDYQNPNIIVIGTEMGVYSSDNGGATWDANTAELGRVPTFQVRQQWRPWNKVDNQGMIYVGTHGRGAWSADQLVSVSELAKDKENVINTVNVFPNPATDYTTITFDLNVNADVTYSVFNMQGKLIETKTLNNTLAGSVNQKLDLGTYTKGTYFVNIQANGTNFKVAKFIKR